MLVDTNFQVLTILTKKSILEVDQDRKQKSVTEFVSLKSFYNGNIVHYFTEAAEVNAEGLNIK